MALAFNAGGGRGCISVTANVAPGLSAQFQKAMLEGRWADALSFQDRLWPLHDALFTDASPGPVKYALSRVRPEMPGRSEERRVGKECVSPCRSRWSPSN